MKVMYTLPPRGLASKIEDCANGFYAIAVFSTIVRRLMLTSNPPPFGPSSINMRLRFKTNPTSVRHMMAWWCAWIRKPNGGRRGFVFVATVAAASHQTICFVLSLRFFFAAVCFVCASSDYIRGGFRVLQFGSRSDANMFGWYIKRPQRSEADPSWVSAVEARAFVLFLLSCSRSERNFRKAASRAVRREENKKAKPVCFIQSFWKTLSQEIVQEFLESNKP